MTASPSLLRFAAIGTHWEIETAEPLSRAVHAAVLTRIDAFDAVWSRFRADSLVTRIARSAHGGRFGFPADAAVLFDLYDRLHDATGGAVDPLVGGDLERLGYDARYSLTPRSGRRGTARWHRDVRRRGTEVVTTGPVVLDVGAAGKGRLIDLVVEVLRDAGVDRCVVDAGGDIRVVGGPLRVGLQQPGAPDRAIGVATLQDGAICASAVDRRAWGAGLHHVLDARTGDPVRTVAATWAIGPDAAVADGVATALFFRPARELAERFGVQCVRLSVDGAADRSAGSAVELFLAPPRSGIAAVPPGTPASVPVPLRAAVHSGAA